MSWGKNPAQWDRPITVRLGERELGQLEALADSAELREVMFKSRYGRRLTRTDTVRALIRLAATGRMTPTSVPVPRASSPAASYASAPAPAAARKTARAAGRRRS